MTHQPNSIFHFTKKKENLIGILKENFKIKYCSEEIKISDDNNGRTQGHIIGVPMISFRDNQNDPKKTYGEYGIGLTREWAIKNGLNPVIYIEINSLFGKSYEIIYDELITKAIGRGAGKNSDLNQVEKSTLDILRYAKNHTGDAKRRDGTIMNNYKFYDDREWRYVIDYNEIEEMLIPLFEKKTPDEKDALNNKISHHKLKFSPEDISHIILADELETMGFLQDIKNGNENNYSSDVIEMLKTKIVIAEKTLELA